MKLSLSAFEKNHLSSSSATSEVTLTRGAMCALCELKVLQRFHLMQLKKLTISKQTSVKGRHFHRRSEWHVSQDWSENHLEWKAYFHFTEILKRSLEASVLPSTLRCSNRYKCVQKIKLPPMPHFFHFFLQSFVYEQLQAEFVVKAAAAPVLFS